MSQLLRVVIHSCQKLKKKNQNKTKQKQKQDLFLKHYHHSYCIFVNFIYNMHQECGQSFTFLTEEGCSSNRNVLVKPLSTFNPLDL